MEGMTNAQHVSYKSLCTLARFTAPMVGPAEELGTRSAEGHKTAIVKVEWGRDTYRFMIEPNGCIAQVLA